MAVENNTSCGITPVSAQQRSVLWLNCILAQEQGDFCPSTAFRWGNQQQEVSLNLLITGMWAAAGALPVTLAGFGRICAAQEAQPLGSRWHFHVSHQNAKFFNGFLTQNSTAGTARAGSEQKKWEWTEPGGTKGCSSLCQGIQRQGWDAAGKKVLSRADLTAAHSKGNSLYCPLAQTGLPYLGQVAVSDGW